MLNMFEKLKTLGGLLGSVMTSADATAKIHSQTVSVYMSYFTFLVRVALLGTAMYIFMFWPVDTYDGAGFDTWSARMEALPEEVWYFLFTMILGWGTTEIVSTRARSAVRMKALDAIAAETTAAAPAEPTAPVEDFMQQSMDDPGMAGRVEPDEEFFMEPPTNNPSIAKWRADAP